jgi:colanic acid biosynthesis glycosyl transferase WcaI
MRILILTQWYLPEPVHLISELAESWQAMGHEVTVLTGFPNYPAGKVCPGYRLRWHQREKINGIPVIRVPLYPEHSKSAVRRVLNYVSFALSAALLGPWLAPRVDVIHVYHPPGTVGWPAWVLSRLKRVPFTYNIQDMWPETLAATRMLNNRLALRMVGWYAKWVYRRAAAIHVISPGFRENLLSKGVPDEKIHVISNWVDTGLYRPVPPDPQLAQKHGLAGRFNVMYAGNMGQAQALDVVFDTAALLGDLPDVQFVLVGGGADLKRLRAVHQERKLDNVKFLGSFAIEEMSGLYALTDILLVHLRDDPLFRITIPHKIFAYMASGRPVLAAMAGDAANVIRWAKAGLICTPSSPQALADAVRQFHAMPLAQRQEMADNGRRAMLESYGRDTLVGKLASMLESAVKEHKMGSRRRRA